MVCALQTHWSVPCRGIKTIFIIIEAKGKIIYHSLTSIIDVALRARVIPFSYFMEIKASLISHRTLLTTLRVIIHAVVCCILYRDSYTTRASNIVYHHLQIRIWIYIHTDIHLNISFIRTFDIVLCKWINIVDKHPEHDSEQYVDVSVDTVLFFCVVVCMLRHMRAFVYRQSMEGKKKKKKRRKVKTLVIVIVRALLNARMSLLRKYYFYFFVCWIL